MRRSKVIKYLDVIRRGDGRGTAIYVKDIYEAKILSSIYTKECEMIAVHIEKINTSTIVIYRPSATDVAEFNPILEELKSVLARMKEPSSTIVLYGDFKGIEGSEFFFFLK